MSKGEKCTCNACKNTVFQCQICKFVGFLLPSSSWLLKLPFVSQAKTQYLIEFALNLPSSLVEQNVHGNSNFKTIIRINRRSSTRTNGGAVGPPST